MIKIVYKSPDFIPILRTPGQINLIAGDSGHYFKAGQLVFRVFVGIKLLIPDNVTALVIPPDRFVLDYPWINYPVQRVTTMEEVSVYFSCPVDEIERCNGLFDPRSRNLRVNPGMIIGQLVFSQLDKETVITTEIDERVFGYV